MKTRNHIKFITGLILFLLVPYFMQAQERLIAFPKTPYVSQKVAKASVFNKVDQHIIEQIKLGSFPGCQVIAVHKGEVIYHKNFGSLDYNIQNRVNDTTIYDIASISKILSTTLAIMKLHEEGKIDINHYASQYLDFLKGTNKAHVTIKSALLHEAGLKAWIPFYKNTLDEDDIPLNSIYKDKADGFYRLPVARNMFMDIRHMNKVWQEIMESPVGNRNYVYSDLDFYILERIIKVVTSEDLDIYAEKHFFKPMGLRNTIFNPWKKNLVNRCAPTEIDKYFRHQVVRGFVHDQGAAMMGGVGGHAGMFSTAKEVAMMMQMLANGGVYQGRRYFKEETIKLFTAYNSSKSRRGLGFDKRGKKGDDGPASGKSSVSTFGHLGFTGTVTWADPTNELVYVFLSNRTYPDADKNLLARNKTRKILHEYFYEAIGK